MRTRRLTPILTAAAVVLGASSAVFAAEGGPALFTLASDEVDEEAEDDASIDEPESSAAAQDLDEPVLEPSAEDSGESEEPEVDAEEEAESSEVDEEAPDTDDDADDTDDEQSVFSAWVEEFDFETEGCHRGQTIARAARQGPENFDREEFDPDNDCVLLEDRPGNRGEDADDDTRPEDAGPPEQAGPPEDAGPPEPAGGQDGRPPEHAGVPGPPDHADRDEDAGPPEHARSRGNRDRGAGPEEDTESDDVVSNEDGDGADSDVTEVEPETDTE